MKKNFFIIFMAILLINSFIYVVNASDIKFSDVPDNHWAKTSIEHLNSRGTLSGYEDGTFKPDNKITRAEAAKILMTTFKSSSLDSYSLKTATIDVPESHWAYKYVLDGKLYILPDEYGNFRPDEVITRGDFAYALYEIIKYDLPLTSNTKYFKDVRNEDPNYVAIYELYNNGLINGFEDNTFRPNEGLTRAQVCKLVDDAYNYLINNKTSSEVKVDIPDIPTESFASQAISDSDETAYINDVISINKNTYESLYETITRPVYYRLRKLYSGEEAEQIIENYNNNDNISSGFKYVRKIQDGNLYCVLFDIDLRDFYHIKEGDSFTELSFMPYPQITIMDFTSGQLGSTLGTIMPNEPEKSLYYTGDLTQMFVIFETPEDVEATTIYISFKNDDDNSYKKFFISNLF